MKTASRTVAARAPGENTRNGSDSTTQAPDAAVELGQRVEKRTPALRPEHQGLLVQVVEPARRQKMLIVDDIEANLVAMERTLAPLGAELVCVTSGEQALRATLSDDFAAAIIDVQMPGMDGYELAEHLRSDSHTADMPILFVSANYTEEHHIFRGYSAGAVDFMTKPLKPEVLLGKLRFFLKANQLQEELKAQVRVKESENFLQSILLSFGDAVLVTDASAQVVLANGAAAELLELAIDDIKGRTVRSVLNLPGVGGLKEQRDHEMRLCIAPDHERPVRITVTPLQDHRGQVVVLFDLSAVNAARENEQALKDQLQHARHFESLGRLAGGVAHDLNNLLTIIQLCGNFITEDADDPVLVREEIEKCLDASRRGEALVRDLLAVARKQILKPRSVSVTDALRQSIGLLTRLLGTDIEIEADLPEEPLTVEIDPDKLSQIVMNLSVNARDAMPQGGTLTVAAWREAGPGHGDSDQVVVEIRDTGVGMPTSILDRAFEPFYTTKGSNKGTGLGLAMVHGIVTQSGGAILVASEEGVGTTFTMRFPCSRTRTQAAVAEPPPEHLQHSAHQALSAKQRHEARVLLVEDDANVRRGLERILRSGGYAIESAWDLSSALELLESSNAFDLLVSDVSLPGPSGVVVAERVRGRIEGLPVIFLSGNPGDLLESWDCEAVGTSFIQKPFLPKTLLSEVAKLLRENERAPSVGRA